MTGPVDEIECGSGIIGEDLGSLIEPLNITSTSKSRISISYNLPKNPSYIDLFLTRINEPSSKIKLISGVHSGQNELEIDIQKWQPGLYLLELVSPLGIERKKIWIE